MKIQTYLFLLLLTAGLSVPVYGQTTLTQKLDQLVRTKLAPESDVGISVYDLTADKPLYTYRDKKLSRPASNMKILTVLTALSQPDADEPFCTHVWYKGSIKDSVLTGDLYVVGGYDPEFEEMRMDSLIDKMLTFPFSAIQGKIYGDVSMKDSLYWGAGWSWDDTPYYYQPYLTPLMFCKGVVTVTAMPGLRGDTASLSVKPASSFYTLANETQSRTEEAGKFVVTRNWLDNKNDIRVGGNITGKRVGDVNVYPTQDFFMHTFVERLKNRGIALDSNYEYAEFVPDSTAVLMACTEQPIQKVLEQILKESDNMATEALMCKMAAYKTGKKRISAEDGLDMIKEVIARIGHDPDKYTLGDACGLSGYNTISPALLVDLLKYAWTDKEIYAKFYPALPIGGIDGTLKARMKKGTKAYDNVRAKTGTISGISTLSGYAKASNGHEIAFSIMNQNTLKGASAREFQNQVCEAICQ